MKVTFGDADIAEALGFWLTQTRMRMPVRVARLNIEGRPEPLAISLVGEVETITPTDVIQQIMQQPTPTTPIVLPGIGASGTGSLVPGSIEALAMMEGPDIVRAAPAGTKLKKPPTEAQKKEAEKMSRWGHGAGGALPTQMDEDEDD